MFFKNKHKHESEKPKYKAIYKSLHSENTIEIAVVSPTNVLANFIHQTEGIWEVYMLTVIISLDEEEL